MSGTKFVVDETVSCCPVLCDVVCCSSVVVIVEFTVIVQFKQLACDAFLMFILWYINMFNRNYGSTSVSRSLSS